MTVWTKVWIDVLFFLFLLQKPMLCPALLHARNGQWCSNAAAQYCIHFSNGTLFLALVCWTAPMLLSERVTSAREWSNLRECYCPQNGYTIKSKCLLLIGCDKLLYKKWNVVILIPKKSDVVCINTVIFDYCLSSYTWIFSCYMLFKLSLYSYSSRGRK